jgi:hypothetical protein
LELIIPLLQLDFERLEWLLYLNAVTRLFYEVSYRDFSFNNNTEGVAGRLLVDQAFTVGKGFDLKEFHKLLSQCRGEACKERRLLEKGFLLTRRQDLVSDLVLHGLVVVVALPVGVQECV